VTFDTPADIQHRDRMRECQRIRQRAMIDRHQRRALPARRDIGGAEVVHNRDAERLRQRGSIADLHREMAFGAMQNGLAVKSDNIDGAPLDAMLAQECLDRICVRARDPRLDVRENARPRGPIGHHRSVGDGLPQQRAFLARISAITGGPESRHGFAVGFEQRHVHAVKRRAAHQPDRAQRRHFRPRGLNPLSDLLHHRRNPQHPSSGR
jgi:hypothetical protein